MGQSALHFALRYGEHLSSESAAGPGVRREISLSTSPYEQDLQARSRPVFLHILTSPGAAASSPQSKDTMKWLHVRCRMTDHGVRGTEASKDNEVRPPALVPKIAGSAGRGFCC